MEVYDVSVLDTRVGLMATKCSDVNRFEGIFACNSYKWDINIQDTLSRIYNEQNVVANRIQQNAISQLFTNGDQIIPCPMKTCSALD